MHDLRSIRENPDAFDAGLARRGAEPAAARILGIDERRRAVTTRVQEAQARRNEAMFASPASRPPAFSFCQASFTNTRLGIRTIASRSSMTCHQASPMRFCAVKPSSESTCRSLIIPN